MCRESPEHRYLIWTGCRKAGSPRQRIDCWPLHSKKETWVLPKIAFCFLMVKPHAKAKNWPLICTRPFQTILRVLTGRKKKIPYSSSTKNQTVLTITGSGEWILGGFPVSAQLPFPCPSGAVDSRALGVIHCSALINGLLMALLISLSNLQDHSLSREKESPFLIGIKWLAVRIKCKVHI